MNTTQHNTTQHNTTQHNTTQHNIKWKIYTNYLNSWFYLSSVIRWAHRGNKSNVNVTFLTLGISYASVFITFGKLFIYNKIYVTRKLDFQNAVPVFFLPEAQRDTELGLPVLQLQCYYYLCHLVQISYQQLKIHWRTYPFVQ